MGSSTFNGNLDAKLWEATVMGNLEDITDCLLYHADPNVKTMGSGWTPLHVAARDGRDDIAALLIRHGASVEATAQRGLRPLHLAAYKSCAVTALLLQAGVDPNAQNACQQTALHWACYSGNIESARYILNWQHFTAHSVRNSNGQTALDVACAQVDLKMKRQPGLRQTALDVARARHEDKMIALLESVEASAPVSLAEDTQEMEQDTPVRQPGLSSSGSVVQQMAHLDISRESSLATQMEEDETLNVGSPSYNMSDSDKDRTILELRKELDIMKRSKRALEELEDTVATKKRKIDKAEVELKKQQKEIQVLRQGLNWISKDRYKISKTKPGLLLLISNIDFKDGRKRKGGDKDREALAELFGTTFGYKFESFENCTSQEMKERIFDLANSQEFTSYSCFVVAIMSHGGAKGIRGVNNIGDDYVTEKDITGILGRSATLAGKPKLVLLQVCRGGDWSERIKQQAWSPSSVTSESSSVASDWGDCGDAPSDHETYTYTRAGTDMIVAQAAVAGYKTLRNHTKGAYFIQSFVQRAKQYGRKWDVETIFKKVVNDMVKVTVGKRDAGFVPCISHCTLRKKFFLV